MAITVATIKISYATMMQQTIWEEVRKGNQKRQLVFVFIFYCLELDMQFRKATSLPFFTDFTWNGDSLKGHQTCGLSRVSRSPSLILHDHARLKSGAGTQRSSRPDSCTSSLWGTCRPCAVSRVNTRSEICRGGSFKLLHWLHSNQDAGKIHRQFVMRSPGHWFQWQCGQPSPAASLWSEWFCSWSLGCGRPPLFQSQSRD